MRRRVLLALAAQAAIVTAIAGPSLAVRLTGDEYRLRVRPVDPIDPFRGAYVTLAYAGFDHDYDLPNGRAYVTLRRDGDAWVGDRVLVTPPESGPYVACEADNGGLECGIESWFVSQDRARDAERRLADGGVATVRIGRGGRAVLVGVDG